MSHTTSSIASSGDPPRRAEVHIAGGRRVSLKVFADDFESMARQITRDRFLLGVVDAAENECVLERAILIPANRIDYVVDIDE